MLTKEIFFFLFCTFITSISIKENYIIAEIEIKEEDINKDINIINSFEQNRNEIILEKEKGEKIKKINIRNTQLEDENDALKKKITKFENKKLNSINESDLSSKNIYSKRNNYNEDSLLLKKRIR